MNKKTFITLFLCLWTTLGLWAVDASYYSSINEKQDAALRTAITSLIYTKHTTALSYDWSFDNIDIVDGVVLDMYSTCSWTSSQQGHSYSDICDGYNREHTVPQSLFNEKSPQVGDRHHLFLTDGQVNNIRSSYPFGETDATGYFNKYSNGAKALGEFGNASYAYSSSQKVYEPDDQYKGDIARAILYMAVRYATTNECRAYNETSNSYPVTTWNNPMFSGSLSTNYGLSDEAVQTFLKWHREDKVSSKEIARNTGVEAKQGNRNPFVDYPILVEYLWGTKKGEIFYLDNAVGSFSGDFIPGVSDGSASGSAVEKYTITWSKDGNTSTTTEVYEGSRPTPPDAADCDAHRVFKGWTASSTYSGDGSDLMTEQSDFPQATAAATYYAVYADKQTSGGGGSTEITLDATKDTSFPKDGITLSTSNGALNNGTDYRIYKGATLTIESTVGNMSSIAFTFNGTYDGGGWETSYSPNATTWTSPACTSGSSGKQARITQIIVTVGGGGSTTYSNYSTDCSTCEKVTITFNANGGEGSMTAQQVCPSTSVNLSTNTFTREHYTFTGWNTKANGTGSSYADNASVNIDANLTLYAQWTEDDKYTATFYANGSKHDEKTGYADDVITDLVDPTPCEGYTFVGWLTTTLDETTTNPSAAAVTTIPAANTDYYAVYKRTESSGGGSNEPVEKTVTFSDKGYENAADVTEVTMDNCTLTFAQSTGSNAPKYYTSGSAVRCYKNNTLTITSENNITAISVAVVSGYAGTISADVGSYASNAWSGSSKSVVLTHAPTNTDQWRMTAITVTTEGGGSSSTTYYSTSCSAACNATITVQSLDDAQGAVSFE